MVGKEAATSSCLVAWRLFTSTYACTYVHTYPYAHTGIARLKYIIYACFFLGSCVCGHATGSQHAPDQNMCVVAFGFASRAHGARPSPYNICVCVFLTCKRPTQICVCVFRPASARQNGVRSTIHFTTRSHRSWHTRTHAHACTRTCMHTHTRKHVHTYTITPKSVQKSLLATPA